MFVAQSKDDLDILNQHINDNPVNGRKLRIATWYKQCNDESFPPPPMTREQVRLSFWPSVALLMYAFLDG